MTDYDQSLLFDLETTWGDILGAITAKQDSNNLLRGVSFVDEYRGKQIPDGKKSVTFRLAIGSLEKTLTSNEIEACAQAIVKRLQKELGAEQRG
jgi:phenylalanyl-tRNA synthetase beta chain